MKFSMPRSKIESKTNNISLFRLIRNWKEKIFIFLFKGTVIQTEKALTNDRLRVSEVF